jgi:hypothetical protein
VSQFDKSVIPGEPNDIGRDPESRKIAENQMILDPGSHPAPRDLAGMTNCDTVSRRRGLTIYLFQGGFMATDQSDKGSKAAGSTTTQAGAQPKIVWDDSGMRSVYANVSNVAGGREEIVLLFGMNQAWHAGQKEVKVQLTDRIVLSPFAAKRFSMLLNNVLQDYEKRYGTLEVGAPQAPPSSIQ